MAKKNRYDLLFEDLSERFSKIPNFQNVSGDEKGKTILDFVTARIAEIHSFKSLFLNYYLPAASKSVSDDIKEFQKSKYAPLLNITREDFKENLYDTIRLGYIGMFHKYENFIDDLIDKSELLIEDASDNSQSLKDYVKEHFDYKIKDWRNSQTIREINWIAICNKHYDGYPKKNPRPLTYSDLDENVKMKFTKQDFAGHIDMLMQHYQLTLTIVFYLAIHKMMFADGLEDYLSGDKSDQNLIQQKENLEKELTKLIAGVKLF